MSKLISLSRRSFLGSSLAAGAVAGSIGMATFPMAASAAAPKAGTQVAGAIRRSVGSLEVTALLDGYLDIGKELVVGYEDDAAKSLREAAFIEGEAVRAPVSAYLVNTGDKLILVDAGTSNVMGPNLGRLLEPLTAAGVSADQVDAVLITHMHPDHLFGVLDPSGEKVFKNAELILPETDKAFWYDDANLNAAPEGMKGFFLGARKAADAYSDRQTLFGDDQEIAPGIRSMALPGHTPGHSGFVLSSDGETLILAADVVHMAAYQFARPEWAIAFDVDNAAAIETRKKFFDMAATDRVMFAGAHIPFPGFGQLAKDGDGYRFVPAQWPYEL